MVLRHRHRAEMPFGSEAKPEAKPEARKELKVSVTGTEEVSINKTQARLEISTLLLSLLSYHLYSIES